MIFLTFGGWYAYGGIGSDFFRGVPHFWKVCKISILHFLDPPPFLSPFSVMDGDEGRLDRGAMEDKDDYTGTCDDEEDDNVYGGISWSPIPSRQSEDKEQPQSLCRGDWHITFSWEKNHRSCHFFYAHTYIPNLAFVC